MEELGRTMIRNEGFADRSSFEMEELGKTIIRNEGFEDCSKAWNSVLPFC
jgi:hypothetical protein